MNRLQEKALNQALREMEDCRTIFLDVFTKKKPVPEKVEISFDETSELLSGLTKAQQWVKAVLNGEQDRE